MDDRLTVLRNIDRLRQELSANARDSDHPPRLLPVTKTQPAGRISVLRDAGIDVIGENRVQEIAQKYPDLSPSFSIHLIGRLQTNKIKYIIGKVCMIHSLDRMPLATALDKHAQAAGIRMPVLVEVNIGGELQKAGIAPCEAETFMRECAKLPGLRLCGLMAVMPNTPDPETVRPLFRDMRALFDRLRMQAIDGVELTELSMGMSGDYKIAAQEGATIVRVGSAIFGERV